MRNRAVLWRIRRVRGRQQLHEGHLLRQVINKLGERSTSTARPNATSSTATSTRRSCATCRTRRQRRASSTPRAVTQFIVDMVNPQLGEKVFDPATGTGGFLVCAIEHLRRQVKNAGHETQHSEQHPGVEKKQLPHMLCVTNLMLHNVEVPTHRPRQYAEPAAARLHAGRARGRGDCHQPALRRHRGRHRKISRPTCAPKNRRLVLVLIKAPSSSPVAAPRWSARRHAVRRRREVRIKAAAPSTQPAHHRPPAQRRVQPLHRHQDQPAVLHQGTESPRGLVLRTPLPAM